MRHMDEGMAMLTVGMEGPSTRWNHDCEVTHMRLHHDHFHDYCLYPHHTSDEGTGCKGVFPWHTSGLMFSHLQMDLIEHVWSKFYVSFKKIQ
jgi:hypothetical protein